MSALQSRKNQDLQKPFSGCVGRISNVFDLRTTSMGGTKLLADKAHRDGSPGRRDRPEVVKKATNPIVLHSEDRLKTNELRKSSSSKKSGGTPMKMLIAQEMSKEIESKRKTTNVVARLMGLDEALPTHSSAKERAERGHSSHVTLAGAIQGNRQQEDSNFGLPMPCGIHSSFQREKEYGDVHEVWQQSPRNRHIKDQYLQRGRYDENQSERRMALVRQKFMEAKQLATDEKLLQSKEFEDALHILSSNRDLFLKFLDEPNSLFSKHLKGVHSKALPPQTKRITILKPSRTPSTKGDIQEQKQQCPTYVEGGMDFNKPYWSSGVTQPTRIVVLKPTFPKHHDTKPIVTRHTSSEFMERSCFYPDLESGESRELSKEIPRKMREKLVKHQRDESLLSSVLSNGYVGDDSSFTRSENEYVEEEGANFSDSEIVTPTSRHSWDFGNRDEGPCSLSSYSRTSCSPESSVMREAKKRLSERYALVASSGFGREQMEARRSSSTLGEMLAIPEAKKEGVEVGGLTVSSNMTCGGEKDSNVSTANMTTCKEKGGDDGEKSTWNLSRSKSVPVSSSIYNNIGLDSEVPDSRVKDIGLNSEVPDSQIKRPIVPKEAAKINSGKSSLKGKVSRLFFSRNKKNDREKSVPSPLADSDDRVQSGSTEHICQRSDDLLNTSLNSHPEDSHLINSQEESPEASVSLKDGPEQATTSFGAALFLEKPNAPELLGDNESSPSTSNKTSQDQDRPSPTSILDAPFVDDSSTPGSCETSDKGHSSVPIEEVTRSLSWDDTHLELSLPSSSEPSIKLPNSNEEEEEWCLFVQSLMSAADLDNEKLHTVFTKFYSVDSPLDPNLLDMYLDQKEEDAKSRERRSNLRLLFDCVNSALLDIDHIAYLGMYPWAGACNEARKKALEETPLGSEVWVLARDMFFGEDNLETDEPYNSDLVVDRLVKMEIERSGWAKLMRSETDEISKEISESVLEDLVGEAMTDFTAAHLL